ncbi:MAG TPA: enoyl-CoA hydratase-related protein [Myxococcota bacterium]|nr:enoyl-CoA hydratase-related protein [Myxococcota bacterium]
MGILESHSVGAVLTLRLNRPAERNAFNPELIHALTAAFAALPAGTRVVVLTGNGAAFSAGADLNWMRASTRFTQAENEADARSLAALFRSIATAPAVVIAQVNGAALGGGAGLVACCDLAVASDDAKLGFTEARLGLAPAVISPYVIAKIGSSQARRLFLTGEIIPAATACALGLVHAVAPAAEVEATVAGWIRHVLSCGPGAIAATKRLLEAVPALPASQVEAYCVDTIARLRVSSEGQEGLAAFLEKRRAAWVSP